MTGSVRSPRSAVPARSWRISRGVAPGGHLDVDVGELLAEGLEQQREDVEADRHPADQPQRAGHPLLALEDRGAGLLEIVEQPLAQAEQRGAGRGDADLAAQAQEQLLLELFFEQQDLRG